MKKNKIICGIIITFVIMITSCTNKKNEKITISQNETQKKFPGKEYVQSVDSSILKFTCMEFNKKGFTISEGQCCVYCNKGNLSYLVMPYHCFPYDSTKEYMIWGTDYKGKKIELSWRAISWAKDVDATILAVDKIEKIPTLCEQGLIAKNMKPGDSAVLLTPFNVRNVHEKFGIFRNENEVEMNQIFAEPGDSGGLIIGREGIVGIASGTDKGNTLYFVPIEVFEELYISLILDPRNKN